MTKIGEFMKGVWISIKGAWETVYREAQTAISRIRGLSSEDVEEESIDIAH